MPPEASSMMSQTLESGFLAEGARVKEFSSEIAKFIGNPRVVPVSSCTMALTIAFKLSGVGPGTEVISTPLTCVAGNEPIRMLGAKPVWADVDRRTGMLTADKIEPLINSNTRAIYILHKEGAPAEVEEIYSLAKSHNIRVIEDAAHAFGAKRKDKRIGSFGDFVCFSFQAIKHITTGDGGALCAGMKMILSEQKNSNGSALIETQELDAMFGVRISMIGIWGNMNDIAGTLGLAQIKILIGF